VVTSLSDQLTRCAKVMSARPVDAVLDLEKIGPLPFNRTAEAR